jgi:hypothetical protein
VCKREEFFEASARAESDSMGKDKLWGSHTERVVTAGDPLLRMYRTEHGGWN